MLRDEKIRGAFYQYTEGAITYIEFVRYAWAAVTEEDVKAHNRYSGLGNAPERNAAWPFNG